MSLAYFFGEGCSFTRRIKYAGVSRKKKIRKGKVEAEGRVVIRWGKVRDVGFINDITRQRGWKKGLSIIC